MQTARAAGEAGRICAELVYGYNRHPAWDADRYEGCYGEEELVAIDEHGSRHDGFRDRCRQAPMARIRAKAGPCAQFAGFEDFAQLRAKLDGCLTGALLAKDRAARALTKVMIPAALDYPR